MIPPKRGSDSCWREKEDRRRAEVNGTQGQVHQLNFVHNSLLFSIVYQDAKVIVIVNNQGPPPHTGPRHFPTQTDISRPTGNVGSGGKCREMSGNVGKCREMSGNVLNQSKTEVIPFNFPFRKSLFWPPQKFSTDCLILVTIPSERK